MRRKLEEERPWTARATWPKGAELETAAPARPADVIADLLVPLGQALVTGGLLAGLVVFLVWELVPDLDGEPVKVWAILGLAIASVAWILLLTDTRRLLWALERVTGIDVDGDGQAGEPAERVVFVNAAGAREEAAQREKAERASAFADFVRRLPARGTSLRAWEREIGRDRYCEYRDALLRVGWAKWKSYDRHGRPNERRGWALTVDPAEILGRLE